MRFISHMFSRGKDMHIVKEYHGSGDKVMSLILHINAHVCVCVCDIPSQHTQYCPCVCNIPCPVQAQPLQHFYHLHFELWLAVGSGY